MLSRISKFGVPGYQALRNKINGLFMDHFGLVYTGGGDDGASIKEYFEAWKLRGHDPSLYRGGKRNLAPFRSSEWDKYLFNSSYGNVGVSERVERLYYRYHFDSAAKVMGTRSLHYDVPEDYIAMVEQLQVCMQKWISRKHIGIETNPSSNVLIGGISRYDEHPIQKWYNVGLTSDNELLKTSPQSFISINTDDQGVFNTCLENEYALLACALEKMRNEDGSPVYNHAQIYEWLDNIRKMGLQQSFRLIDFANRVDVV